MEPRPGRPLPPSAFGDDDGQVDPAVEAALAAFDAGTGDGAAVLSALVDHRLLVPVVAVTDELGVEVQTPHGPVATEKSSHMAAVTITSREGRVGLLAFTSTATMARWDPAARPVPVGTRAAAEAALAENAHALVIDLAGPVTFPVNEPVLRALTDGWQPLSDDHGGVTWAAPVALAQPAQPEQQKEPATPDPTSRKRHRSWRSRVRGFTRRGR